MMERAGCSERCGAVLPCCFDMRRRRNGYDCPPDPLQLASWVLLVSFALVFGALWVPQLDTAGAAVSITAYVAVLLVTMHSAHRTASTDPADTHAICPPCDEPP